MCGGNVMRMCQALLAVLLSAGNCPAASGFDARVVVIPDGDTVEVYREGERFRTAVDLYGIDCPEAQQYFGKDAKDATAALVALKAVWIEVISEDRSGRPRAVVTVEGKNVNEILVSKGWAWVIPDECSQPFCDDWRRLQEEARGNRTGLWAAPQPQAPWEWRKRGTRELLYPPGGNTPLWRRAP
jgi:endonuclease YncB( thermonuclease family)